jgi:SAM-dependent methyltransferase
VSDAPSAGGRCAAAAGRPLGRPQPHARQSERDDRRRPDAADGIPSAAFDCLIVTQTLQFVFDVRAAVATLRRILKPGGVLLASVPATSQAWRYDMDRWGDFWRFTDAAVRRLLAGAFGADAVTVQAHGNVLATLGFLHGLAAVELDAAELDSADPDYQLLVRARARKPSADA